MQNLDDPHNSGDLIADAREEIVGMAKQGMVHPSTKPVLTAGAIGAVAGAVLPVVSWPARGCRLHALQAPASVKADAHR